MTLWIPSPRDVISGRAQRATGTGNMGDVTDRTSQARFWLDADRYALCWLRARFTGGTGSATLTLKLDHRDDIEVYDFTLRDWETMGTSGDAWLYSRITADELFHWTFQRGDIIVFEWTNPDPAVMRWALEVGLCDATG